MTMSFPFLMLHYCQILNVENVYVDSETVTILGTYRSQNRM